MENTKKMLAFIEQSTTPYQAVAQARALLEQNGFTELHESAKWDVKPGGKYYVTRNLSSVIAFSVPSTGFGPMLITASHCDSPAYKLKETMETVVRNQYIRPNTEGYGGIFHATWMDRPLSIAGRVMVKTKTGVETRLLSIDRDLLIIPNIALHLNRDANKSFSLNAAVDMQPVLCETDGTEKNVLKTLVAKELDVAPEDIISNDLFLYMRQKGVVFGVNNEFLLVPRFDDLGCVWTTLEGFLQSDRNAVSVWCMFDHEEVGSQTKQAAGSTFLPDIMQRACTALGGTQEDYLAALPSSILVSADNAHATHPGHPEVADQACLIRLNGGVVIKCAANQSYTTDAMSSAIFKTICERADVPVQLYYNRSDLGAGSTLGKVVSTNMSVISVDIGLPQLAMHSSCETAGTRDATYMVKAIKEFYNVTPMHSVDGTFTI